MKCGKHRTTGLRPIKASDKPTSKSKHWKIEKENNAPGPAKEPFVTFIELRGRGSRILIRRSTCGGRVRFLDFWRSSASAPCKHSRRQIENRRLMLGATGFSLP